MVEFIKKDFDENRFELTLDGDIFEIEVIMKAAYMLLSKGYFFFKKWEKNEIILQFTRKKDVSENPETIIWEYSDELLNVTLRTKLEKENKFIRESIVHSAINNAIDQRNFVSLDTDQNQVNFDKDIEEILREIEKSPEFKIDEKEIEKIIEEMEQTSKNPSAKKATLDPNKVSDAKKRFQNRK